MKRRCFIRISRKFVCTILLGFIIGFLSSQLSFGWRRTPKYLEPIKFPKTVTAMTESNPIKDDQRQFVFVGVLTARKFLKTRAEAVYKTWGSSVPGQLMFFVGTGGDLNTSLPVVVLPDVPDDIHPPLHKSFAMIKYMSIHYTKGFKWILRMDDDVYLNMKRLIPILRRTDNSKDIYMGYPGRGSYGEMGKLGIRKPYCCGGPGVIFSSSLLRKLSPHISKCVNRTVTNHEDTELGRCVESVSGQGCKAAGSSALMISHNDQTGAWTLKLPWKRMNSISFHPIKDPINMFSFYSRYKSMSN